MRKSLKKLSLGMILVFLLMIFKPYSVLAEGGSKTPVKISVNVQITAANKTYDPKISLDENFKTTVTSVKVVSENGKDAALIDKYKVNGSYEGEVKLDGPTIGDVPVLIDNSKLKITYTPNDDYEFTLNKVLPVSVKVFDDGAATPTIEEQKKQIERAKKAEDDLYSKLGIGKGTVPEFSWGGSRSIDGKAEGTIELNDYVWEVFSSARSGYTGVRAGFYDDWFKMIQNGLQKMKDKGITARDVKLTEWEKLILAITAIGYDARDIKSYDLIEIVSNKANKAASPEYLSLQYGILALTCNDYMDSVSQDENHINRAYIENYVQGCAANKIANSGKEIINSISDLAYMQIQPMVAYYDPNAEKGDKYYDVKQAMQIVFDEFSNAQTYGGFFLGRKGVYK
ncbi:hypothetical protein CcarbDRAFT_1412 [Clostridium carboxidivorans P7]|uniref:Uncharacterized protein n=1 Tax=Clostridium carboxidivorans P7 TaxID=536227 RepID=C6PRJ5_9CLOT|nr:hypothetical protein [Clostridium carboxidivorans]EET88176.1 hypothetical protein CcarbDRAFT_1412 [Clostridium carboxidivorans P7]